MYPPPSSSKSTAPDGGDAENYPYDETTGSFSSLGSQTHHNLPSPPPQQHNPNVVGFGHYFSGEPSTIGHSGASSSSLFRHRSSPAGFYDQLLPTDPNGKFCVSYVFHHNILLYSRQYANSNALLHIGTS